ncbi:hypothetical protein [Paenirhodobacter sp.]|uniref:hypothetical protein n=1 Tax=Paenirhodobacter sp. TaxID=1965326 RepID=UPI003B3EBAC5
MSAAPAQTVRRRRVFYIPGYDPFHPRRYRELYRREGAEQARISGYGLRLLPGQGGRGWSVVSEQDGMETRTEFEVLTWSDIVRASMGGSVAATYAQMVRTAWVYVTTGALFRLMRLRRGPILAALYPVVALLVQALVALAAGLAVFALLPGVVGLIGLAVTVILVLNGFRRHDRRFFAYYLMHDYAFTARWRGAYPPDLDARLAEFGDRIAAAAEQDWDEVLLIGHSSGAHLAVSVLARLLQQGRLPPGAKVSLLTLGQAMPMVTYLPEARALRADLARMGAQERIFWLDVTAPGDACAFALCDPVAVSGLVPTGAAPLVISAAFRKTLSPERWRALRRRFFRLHFQYLCAFDRPDAYDYFRITAGPRRLPERFAEARPSRSRITRSANRFTAT